MRTYVTNLMAILVLVSLYIGSDDARAQQAKQGQYSVYFSWHAVGRMNAMAEGYAITSATAWGVLINRDGKGFLHDAPTSCSAAVKVVGGSAAETGFCASTDADGDRAYMRWLCAYDANGWCVGDFDWTDGTGKYQGLTGKSKIRYKIFGFRPSEAAQDGTTFAAEGYSIWEGEWRSQ